jgi:hypothetical protein
MLRLPRTRVALAVLGAVLIGGVAATVAAMGAVQPGSTATSTSQAQAHANTATATLAPTATAATAPTETAAPRPTSTPRPPTPTATATFFAGQSVNVSGSILTVGTTTFSLQSRGSTFSVAVNNSTLCRNQGTLVSCSQLVVRWEAQVQGIYQNNLTILATAVNDQPDT